MDPNAQILAVDLGFRATGLALARLEKGRILITGHVVETGKLPLRTTRKAEHDLARARHLMAEIDSWRRGDPFWDRIVGLLLEIPHAGAQGARANRCMGIATGIGAALAEMLAIPVEAYLPDECTLAVLGVRNPRKVQSGTIARGVQAGQPRMVSLKKKLVRESIERRFDVAPDSRVRAGALEHIYDAAACLVAARRGNIVRAAGWPDHMFDERKVEG